MKYDVKYLEKSQVELTITVEPADYRTELEKAAVRISERAAIKGFRPGKAPYDMVKQQVGETRILEEAMQPIVEKHFHTAVKAEKLDTIGMPQITIIKAAPGNDFVFKAVVALLPKVKPTDLDKVKVRRGPKEIGDKEVSDVLTDLTKMQAKEVLRGGKASKDDKVLVKMEMFIDKVAVEGGQAQNHGVYLNEPHYIPGFAEQLVGLQKDDTKEFTLKFPDQHYQKHLAGKDVDFKVTVNDVYELQYPTVNDEFAKTLGQKNLDDLKGLVKKNLTEEAKQKDEQRIEVEILDKLVAASEFGEIPDVLVNAEKNKIFHELKYNLERQGISIEQYMNDLKKTQEALYNDFTEQAVRRVKAALISRQIALENNIRAEKEDIDKEIAAIKVTYPDNPTVEENLKKPEVLDTLAVTIQNRKVIQWLKDKILK